ncbi:uncharacterized protein DUF3500 [Nocardiopsis sp. Huas11]|uniref:DUF3500 domain-containing protein n=1 Tax=Nocardiopsis sp. Huas11 TaxID=2183912 RepID=UPI000EB2478B|nr:DUF3500 domain-containing protein [Nocardiopsis sp. Huas11]RKS08402.1 uncharacterized protein DUF3500 [Nocardiopsis sp. Huas11]
MGIARGSDPGRTGPGSTASEASTSSSSSSTSETATTASSATTSAETIADTTAAAEEFMATLSDEQREELLHAYDDESKTTTWSNFPVTFVDRAGLNLEDLGEEQRAAAMKVLESLLSEEGYETATGIMGADELLLENSSSTEDSLGQYYIAFFGDPSDSSAWQVQFGGHHLGLNATLDGSDDAITFAPTHPGLQAAVYTDEEGNGVEPRLRRTCLSTGAHHVRHGRRARRCRRGAVVRCGSGALPAHRRRTPTRRLPAGGRARGRNGSPTPRPGGSHAPWDGRLGGPPGRIRPTPMNVSAGRVMGGSGVTARAEAARHHSSIERRHRLWKATGFN